MMEELSKDDKDTLKSIQTFLEIARDSYNRIEVNGLLLLVIIMQNDGADYTELSEKAGTSVASVSRNCSLFNGIHTTKEASILHPKRLSAWLTARGKSFRNRITKVS